MDYNPDIKVFFDDWPFDPEQNIRIVAFPDGREVMQVRTPLGIEQYELSGRPDGQQPHGRESLLAYQIERMERLQATDAAAAFVLTPEECAALFEEGVLYYCRYLHLFQFQDWERTLRDTSRNLKLFDFVHAFAAREDEQAYLEQWRPYILRMHAVSEAMIELRLERFDRALLAIKRAIRAIQQLPEMDQPTFRYERNRSLQALGDMSEDIQKSKPRSELEKLENALYRAVKAEAYELAAELRDRIRHLRSERAV